MCNKDSTKLGKAKEADWTRLKRIVKNTYGARSLWQLVESKGEGNLKVFTDFDWAGDKVARKSSGCAVIQLDGVTLATYVPGQSVEALSSA